MVMIAIRGEIIGPGRGRLENDTMDDARCGGGGGRSRAVHVVI